MQCGVFSPRYMSHLCVVGFGGPPMLVLDVLFSRLCELSGGWPQHQQASIFIS